MARALNIPVITPDQQRGERCWRTGWTRWRWARPRTSGLPAGWCASCPAPPSGSPRSTGELPASDHAVPAVGNGASL